jgi:hypothetical protein
MQLYRFGAHGRKIGAVTANYDLSAAHNAPKAGEKPNSPAAPPTTPTANSIFSRGDEDSPSVSPSFHRHEIVFSLRAGIIEGQPSPTSPGVGAHLTLQISN